MSTPLDALSSPPSAGSGPPADEERVRRILAEMNAEAIHQPVPGFQQETPRVITEPPITMSTGQLRMDPGTSRANVIGGSAPTMADFHAMLQQSAPGMAAGMTPFYPREEAGPGFAAPIAKPPTWKASLAIALRGPVAVAIIVFLLNLPVVTSILSRYASWMYLSSGEISVGGLLVKALLSAILFAVYQGVFSVVDKS